MRKLCICDLDGVIADSTARFAKAEEAKHAVLAGKGLLAQVDASLRGIKQDLVKQATEKRNSGLVLWHEEVYQKEDMQEADKVYWQTAFTPELVALDTLIDNVSWSLNRIEDAGYEVVYLTSRPESLREATTKWFHTLPEKHGLRGRITPESKLGIDQLIMKPASQQYVKTITWKSGVVELLVRLFGVDELLFVDDEQAHCDMVESLDLPCDRIICGSLQEAIVSIREK